VIGKTEDNVWKSGNGRIEEGSFRFFGIIRKIILEWNEKDKS
jgi:hypothetical protein